jgi:DNA polymerase-3 subunit delta'
MHSDVHLTERARFLEVKEIRSVIMEAGNCPSAGEFKTFILDGADRLTVEAADALLKTLEEPPETARFFLLAEDGSRVAPTIRSRCRTVQYSPLPEAFVESVVRRHEDDAGKALVYSRMGEGSAGRAIDYWSAGKLSLRDQILTLTQAGLERSLPSAFSLVDAMKGDLELAMLFTEQVIRDVLIVELDPMRVINLDVVDTLKAIHAKRAPGMWMEFARKLGALRSRASRVSLNLPFQFKTILAESFV